MLKIVKSLFFLIVFILNTNILKSDTNFQLWLNDFKTKAIAQGVSKQTVEVALQNAKFLPKVIEYDRYQPEFYEDTFTYIKKRANKDRTKKGVMLYKREKSIINTIEKRFFVEKELLLALMGIETNFGKHLGKMDIISSLATLSYDKRRSEFFSAELITLLKLIDIKVIDKDILYGSWAGAFGNFQFMPSTIKNYAIDYDKDTNIELKKIEDSFASAANYLNKIGWKKNQPCYIKIELKNNIPSKYLNTSAKKLINKRNLRFFKRYINNADNVVFEDNLKAAIITPDKDIIPGAQTLTPAYLVFSNYERILKWNRSLRFALAVCTLKDKIKNEI